MEENNQGDGGGVRVGNGFASPSAFTSRKIIARLRAGSRTHGSTLGLLLGRGLNVVSDIRRLEESAVGPGS